MIQLIFTILFRTPFHVGIGLARDGLDQAVDHDVPLPASSLKGLMREEARDRLRLNAIVDEVFGTERDPSPWAWGDAELLRDAHGKQELHIGRHARIRVLPDTPGTVKPNALLLAERVLADRATFTVTQIRPVESPEPHLLVLRAAARSVTALGAGRRRGQGWVSITTGGWGLGDTKALQELRRPA